MYHKIHAALQRAADKDALFAQLKVEYDLMGCDLRDIELVGENGNYEVHAYLIPRKPIKMVSFHFVVPDRSCEEVIGDHAKAMGGHL